MERIVRVLGPATYEEFTVEVNPDDVVAGGPEYVAGLRALGVNRVSMGVQSFDDGILRWMNRRHDAAGAREAFHLLRAGGFDNVSIDLIFGLSQLTEAVWESTIDEALVMGPEHISAYQLSIEEDSALERMVAEGRYVEASDEQCRGQYDILCRKLADAGYVHYEVSNWARPGREAVHNSAYWRRVPYVGLGPAAHSLSFPVTPCPGVRSWNTSELARRDADGCLLRWHAEQEVLSEREAAEETIMLALRTAHGLPLAQLRALSPAAPVDDLLAAGALQLLPPTAVPSAYSPWVRIPEDRFFVSDDIIARLFPAG
jgi:oxygen-independent coproporphyrinogen-3 oxidase